MMQLPELNNDLDSTNHAGATSEALKQMMLLGANPIHLDQIQLGPWASPDEKALVLHPSSTRLRPIPTVLWWMCALVNVFSMNLQIVKRELTLS